MSEIEFRQVDVFTVVPFKGNPVAVIMDAQGLSDKKMQEIANWTNLSETTFVFPPTDQKADYRVRIFTPGSELPFAGHPTIGTAWALSEAGIINARGGVIVQECEAGLVNLNITENVDGIESIAFELPAPTITELSVAQTDRLEKIIGCKIDRTLTPALVDVGARWIVAHVQDAASVINTEPDYALLGLHDKELGITGVCLYGEYPGQDGFNIEVRSFAPACGVNEDPVCGSGNGSVAAFLRHHKVSLPENGLVLSSQGKVMGRNGKLQLIVADEKIWVGGSAITCIRGNITL